MAQRARIASTVKTPASGARRGRPPGSTSAKAAVTVKARQPAVAKPAARRTPAAASPAPKVSKDELRAQVEKLERTVATLRARSRDAVRAAKQAAARIEELEAQLAVRQKAPKPEGTASRAASPALTATPQAAPRTAKARRGQTLSDQRDPGDAVPPGVAVADPEPMDDEAATAFENLQAHLHPADEPAGS